MSKPMSMTTPIRRVEGKVDVNFFANRHCEVNIVGTSREVSDELFDSYQSQVLTASCNMDKKYATLDGTSRLDDNYFALGSSDHVGWWGDLRSNAAGEFVKNNGESSPQIIKVKYLFESNLSTLYVRGDKMRGEYPTQFDLVFHNGETETKTVSVINNDGGVSCTCKHAVNETCKHNEVTCTFDSKSCEYTFDFGDNLATDAELKIHRWSHPGTMAKISFFSDERVEEFSGDKLQYLEVLEEKTSSVDKLSYDMTANYCKVKLLNEDDKFFNQVNFDLLRKNREIMPYIRCGGEYRSLGKFYSDEWSVPSDSAFITCKAYDILYSLKDVVINYGTMPNENGEMFPIRPYANKSVKKEVIPRLEKLINENRKASGIFGNDIAIDTSGIVDDVTLDYVLIEKKSAWDILQDIANLLCAHIYTNREGVILIEQDNFGDSEREASGVTIDKGNAFSYSMPVSSKNVVNRVDIEYYDLVLDSSNDDYKIKKEDLFDIDEKACFAVDLNKLYLSISNTILELPSIENKLKVVECNFDHIVFQIIPNDSSVNANDIYNAFGEEERVCSIEVSSSSVKRKLEKRNYIESDSLSTLKHGIKEFKRNAGVMMDKNAAMKNAGKIINKYSVGVSYLESEWTGNDVLRPSMTFNGDKDAQNERKTYECLSNEIVLSNRLRQTTKGVES